MKNRLAWLLATMVAGLAIVAITVIRHDSPKGVAVGLLPRQGDILIPHTFVVGDWNPGTNGFIGLNCHVQGPALDPEQRLRFSEGAGRATARIAVVWTNDMGLPVGEPFEAPFKDDC